MWAKVSGFANAVRFRKAISFCLLVILSFGKERLCSLTHLRIDNSDMESFIKDVDDPNKRMLIKKIGCILGLGASFEIVDKEDTGKSGFCSEL